MPEKGPPRSFSSAMDTGSSISIVSGPFAVAPENRWCVFSVIGVLPAGFQFPPDVGLWLPADEEENPSRTSHNLRCRSGASATV